MLGSRCYCNASPDPGRPGKGPRRPAGSRPHSRTLRLGAGNSGFRADCLGLNVALAWLTQRVFAHSVPAYCPLNAGTAVPPGRLWAGEEVPSAAPRPRCPGGRANP